MAYVIQMQNISKQKKTFPSRWRKIKKGMKNGKMVQLGERFTTKQKTCNKSVVVINLSFCFQA
jgi:hypothetical protein